MGDDYSINFLGLDMHWENGLTLEQDTIVHKYVGMVTVNEKCRAAHLLGRSQNLNFQFIVTIELLAILSLKLANSIAPATLVLTLLDFPTFANSHIRIHQVWIQSHIYDLQSILFQPAF
jgi:hypothetical protein